MTAQCKDLIKKIYAAFNARDIDKDLDGNPVFDGTVKHIYTSEEGLLRRMDIELE